jgi:hypothetical protein
VTITDQARAAARNNAEWCASMCRAHGVSSDFGERAWTAPTRTPLFYPDAVTLAPGADAPDLLAHIDVAPGASVKDSFADLDLTGVGFHVLFDAQWLHRPADFPVPESNLSWRVVTDAEELRAWARAWDNGEGHDGLFRPELLEDPATSVLISRDPDGRISAGAVATRSRDVVGISNVYGGADAAGRRSSRRRRRCSRHCPSSPMTAATGWTAPCAQDSSR